LQSLYYHWEKERFTGYGQLPTMAILETEDIKIGYDVKRWFEMQAQEE